MLFLYRKGSMVPFKADLGLDDIEEDQTTGEIKFKENQKLKLRIAECRKFRQQVHFLEYVTVEEYLLLLELYCGLL